MIRAGVPAPIRAAVGLAATVVAAVVAVPVAVPAAAAPGPDRRCVRPGGNVPAVPWAQQLLDQDRAWPFSDGSGVTVAVLSSGTDARHPLLAGRVGRGADFLGAGPGGGGPGGGSGDTDCVGLGTQVAGVLAAAPSAGTGFHGMAPGARVLPVRVAETTVLGADPQRGGTPAGLAAAVRWAVGQRVGVLAVAVVSYSDDPAVRGAVASAVAAGIVVVAAVGEVGSDAGAARVPYPAAYPGVLGVGAIAADGTRWRGSPAGPFVDLVAPGAELLSTQAGGGLAPTEGTGVAAGYVAGAAALVRGRTPGMPAAEVGRRLEATASPVPARPGGPEFGYGVVSPYQAVSEDVSSAATAAPPSYRPDRDGEQRQAAADAARTRQNSRAIVLSAAGGGLALLAVAVAVAVPRGRRRRWRAGLRRLPADDPDAGLPTPPTPLFDQDTV